MKRIVISVTIVAALAGLFTWSIVLMNRWESRCNDAGGQVVTRYEYTQTNVHYTYDGKGNINGSYVTTDPVYSYHCMVNGTEVKV